MLDDIFKKDILTLTNDEIIEEIRHVLNHPGLEPQDREHLGFIADGSFDYVINDIVDEALLKELYNSGKHIDSYIMTLAINSIRNRKKDLFELINEQTMGKKVLDFGCGSGTHSIACAQNGANVFSFDISKRMQQVTGKRGALRSLNGHIILEIREGDCFDTILCTDVLEHVVNPVRVIKNFIRCLKIGGIAHLHISLGKSYERGHLPDSIDRWHSECVPLIEKHFKKISENNYELERK